MIEAAAGKDKELIAYESVVGTVLVGVCGFLKSYLLEDDCFSFGGDDKLPCFDLLDNPIGEVNS